MSANSERRLKAARPLPSQKGTFRFRPIADVNVFPAYRRSISVLGLGGLMISLLMFLAMRPGDPGPPAPIAITCRIDVVEIGYYGPHHSLRPTPPRRRSSQVEYLLDFDRPSLTMESAGRRMVTIDDPVHGSHLVAGPDGIDVETNVAMMGGFVMKRVSHFNRDGSGGSTKQDTLSQGAVVGHEEGTLTCRPRA